MSYNPQIAEMIASGMSTTDIASALHTFSQAIPHALDNTPTMLAVLRMEVGNVARDWPLSMWGEASMWW